MGDVIYLTKRQAAELVRHESGLYYSNETNEYLLHIDKNKYEVVMSPYYTTFTSEKPSDIGHRAETILIDDVSTPIPGTDEYEQYISGLATNLRKYMESSILYGEYPKKEKEMEIGGNTCHLCGEGLLYTDINRTFIKKHRKVESHKVYMCGTTIYETWNEHDVQPHETKHTRRIHAECLC